MEREGIKITNIFLRYVFILLLGLGNLYLFYWLFTPLTINTTSFILGLFQEVSVSGNLIALKNYSIQIVPGCVAGAAYYLLLILIFGTPEIKPLKRFYLTFTSIVLFFILNIGRILFLTLIVGKPYFSIVHWIFWNLMSTIFVVGIWVFLIKLNKIKSIPIFSDMKYVARLRRKRK